MMTNLMTTAVAVLALSGGLAATTSAAPAASASSTPQVVAFNYWHGSREGTTYFGSVRPSVFGNRFGEPLDSLHWQSWSLQGARATGHLVHMSCQPCHATVVLSHAKLRPRGYGYFYNWQTVTFREFHGVSRSRWSFAAREWVSR